MEKVAHLRQQKSKYDIFHKGTTIRFMIESCGCKHGVHALYCRELKKADVLPPFIPVEAVENPDEIIHKAIEGEHVTIKWYEKIFGLTLRGKVDRWARRTRRKILDSFEAEERAERLQDEFRQV